MRPSVQAIVPPWTLVHLCTQYECGPVNAEREDLQIARDLEAARRVSVSASRRQDMRMPVSPLSIGTSSGCAGDVGEATTEAIDRFRKCTVERFLRPDGSSNGE